MLKAIGKFDSNRMADSIRDSIRTKKNDSQVPTFKSCDGKVSLSYNTVMRAFEKHMYNRKVTVKPQDTINDLSYTIYDYESRTYAIRLVPTLPHPWNACNEALKMQHWMTVTYTTDEA